MSVNVSTKMHTWIERYDNKTNVPFVTTDTPVVNLTGMEFLEKMNFIILFRLKSQLNCA